MELRDFSIFIGVIVILGCMYIINRVKKDRQMGKLKDGIFIAVIVVALILYIVGLFR